MPRQAVEIGRNPAFIGKNALVILVFFGLAVQQWSSGSTFYGTVCVLMAGLLAWYTAVSRSALCPDCKTLLNVDVAFNRFERCPGCGTYLEMEKGTLWTVEEDRLAPYPVFAVVVARPPDEALNPKGIALARQPSVKGEDRRLDFKWPPGCCVCGKPATGKQAVSLKAVSKFAKAYGFVDENVTFTVDGIPHCGGHSMGAALDIEDLKLVLKFRSYAYRNSFRKLNELA